MIASEDPMRRGAIAGLRTPDIDADERMPTSCISGEVRRPSATERAHDNPCS
jgi:hypothetical protein